MTETADKLAFRLSRIYAEGWNTARRMDADAALNPYHTEPERTRWNKGFAEAAED